MATIKNLDYYKMMYDYNISQMKCANNNNDRDYYKMMAGHWAQKIAIVTK